MEFLNWASDHPWLFLLILLTCSSVAHGIGNIGRRKIVIKKGDEE